MNESACTCDELEIALHNQEVAMIATNLILGVLTTDELLVLEARLIECKARMRKHGFKFQSRTMAGIDRALVAVDDILSSR